MTKRIGIYSGTFDPVHDGHLAFAKAAIEQCGLEKVFFLVEPRPRRKQAVKALEHRTEMVHLAIADNPKLSSIVLNQQRFTADKTLPVLMELFKGAEIYMLMGDDMLVHLAGWPHVEHLLQNVRFAIGVRKFDQHDAEHRLAELQRTRGLMINYELFQAPMADVSSTKLRQHIKKGQHPAEMSPQVLEYISEHRLYVADGSSAKS